MYLPYEIFKKSDKIEVEEKRGKKRQIKNKFKLVDRQYLIFPKLEGNLMTRVNYFIRENIDAEANLREEKGF